MFNFRPLGERVAIERLNAEEQTAGGLYIPPIAQEKMNRGRVLAIGSAVLDLKAGDLVLFGKYAGSDVTIDGRPASIMREEEVLAVIDGDCIR